MLTIYDLRPRYSRRMTALTVALLVDGLLWWGIVAFVMWVCTRF